LPNISETIPWYRANHFADLGIKRTDSVAVPPRRSVVPRVDAWRPLAELPVAEQEIA
jgi:hypothetical protein